MQFNRSTMTYLRIVCFMLHVLNGVMCAYVYEKQRKRNFWSEILFHMVGKKHDFNRI